jgi:hypothetical protein
MPTGIKMIGTHFQAVKATNPKVIEDLVAVYTKAVSESGFYHYFDCIVCVGLSLIRLCGTIQREIMGNQRFPIYPA